MVVGVKDILFGVNLCPCIRRGDIWSSDIESVPIASAGVEALEGGVPAEVEDLASNVTRQSPDGLSPATFG